MNKQNLIIYKFSSLFYILEELSLDLNFNIIKIDNEKLLNEKIKIYKNFLLISNEKNLNIINHIILDNT